MGWKLNMIILKGLEGDTDSLSSLIGFSYGRRKYEAIGKTTLENCLNPKDDENLYIGIYKDLRIITEANFPFEFLNDKPGLTEKLSRSLTNGKREMYIFGLNSIVNLWGYSKINDASRIRTKFGTHDEGVIHEEGEPLKSEIELISNSELNDGKRVYNYNGNKYNEDQMGEEFVFRIIEEITGERIDKQNELVKTEMTIYKMTEKKGFEDIFQRIRDQQK